jgi:hypothetical protein
MTNGSRIRTFKRFALTTTGIALGTAIVGVAIALVTISFTGSVASNEFATTTTAPPTTTTTTLAPGDGLQAAISINGGGPSQCGAALTGGSLSLGAIVFDLNGSQAQSFEPQAFLCVTNVLSGQVNDITTLTLQATVQSATEDACSVDERTTDPEGPADCGVLGELGDVVQVVLTPFALQDAGCFPNPAGIVPGGSAVSLLFPDPTSGLSGGNICSWEVRLQLSGSATYDQKLAASTDSISLKLDVNGSGT